MELTGTKSEGIKRERWKTGRERKRRRVFGEVLVPSRRGYGCCSITANFKGSSLKPCLETGALPSPSPPYPHPPHPSFLHCLSHSLSLSFFPACTQPLKTAGREAGERQEELGGDKRTQREKDQPCRQQRATSVESNGQCLFLESIFFCRRSGSIWDVVLLSFFTA